MQRNRTHCAVYSSVYKIKKAIKMKLFVVCLMFVAVAHAIPFSPLGGFGSGVSNSQSFSQSNSQSINHGTGLSGYGGLGGIGSQVGSSASSSASTSTSNQIGMEKSLKIN